MEAYRHPSYCEIALAPADIHGEIDFFEAAIAKYSKTKVRHVFELGAELRPIWRSGTNGDTFIVGSTSARR